MLQYIKIPDQLIKNWLIKNWFETLDKGQEYKWY